MLDPEAICLNFFWHIERKIHCSVTRIAPQSRYHLASLLELALSESCLVLKRALASVWALGLLSVLTLVLTSALALVLGLVLTSALTLVLTSVLALVLTSAL